MTAELLAEPGAATRGAPAGPAAPRPGRRVSGPAGRALERLARPAAQRTAVVTGTVGASLMAVGAVSATLLPAPLRWWFSLPAGWTGSAAALDTLADVFTGGLAVLTLSWLAVGAGVRAGRWTVRGLTGAALLWAVPLLAAPVALSTDVYTYLGQGTVAVQGMDPYLVGPAAAELPAPVSDGMGPGWRTTGSPYGPAFLAVAGAAARLAPQHPVWAVLVLRLVAVAGWALVACLLPQLARRLGADPVRASWLGVASPLVLGSFVLGGHNDAVMLGLLVAGLAIAARGRPLLGIGPVPCAVAVCALAATVKAPAAVAVVFLAVAWAGRAPGRWRGGLRLAGAALTAVTVAVVVSVLTGTGASWLAPGALRSPALATTSFTPVTTVTAVIGRLGAAVGLPVPLPELLTTMRTVGLGVALLLGAALLIGHRRVGPARAIGLTLLAAALAGPVTWPWYLTWGVVLLPAASGARPVRALVALAAVPLLLLRPNGMVPALGGPATVLVALTSVGAMAYAALWTWRRLPFTRPRLAAAGGKPAETVGPRG